jgi:histidinol dehydrogenase
VLKLWDPAAFLAHLSERRSSFYPEIEERVREILAQVRSRGDDALYELTARWDKTDLRPTGLEATAAEFEAAEAAVDGSFREALRIAMANIRDFHEHQAPRSWFQTRPDGSILGQQVSAMDRVGVYIPGGSAPLFSCLLMIVIPAVVAGVKEILLCTPPNAEGKIDPHMLVAAQACGVQRVFKVGGAQAIGAMAYGTASIPRVDKIAGPGNYYVTMAKKLVFGPVGIDMLAGPTEVLAVDDGSADADWLAADLLSQAEHPDGMVILVTTGGEERVQVIGAAMARQAERLPRVETVRKSLAELGAVLMAADLAQAAALVNAIAPEHLELEVADAWALLPSIKHAGSIFMGKWTPEPIGDYIAGPSNVIPTEGTARYTYPVSVETFVKRSAIVSYSEAAFLAQAPHAVKLALTEGLQAHAESMLIRLREKQRS